VPPVGISHPRCRFPLAEELAEQWAQEAETRRRRAKAEAVSSKRKPTPSEVAAERWAREAAVIAAEIQFKAFNIELRHIQARNVRDLDAGSSSDPYVVFTLLGCDDLGGAHIPSDRTPHLRNAKHPSWPSPCTLRIPAGSHAACALARLQIEPSMWRLVSKYLTPDIREHAAKEPRIEVTVFDYDPDGQKRREKKAFDDKVGSGSVTLGHTAGLVDMLELPSDEERKQQQQQQQQRSSKVAAAGRADFEAMQHDQPTGMESAPASPIASSRSLFAQLWSWGGDDVEARTKISFEYRITEYVPPPAATLFLRSFTVEGELYPEASGEAASPASPGSPGSASKSSRRSRPVPPPPSPPSAAASGERRPCGPFLRFVLLEVNELPPPSGKLPAASADARAAQPWLDRSLSMRLPEGSPRPPLLRVQLHDEAMCGVKGALCSTEVRLDGFEGSTLVRLDHVVTRQRRGRKQERVRHLAVRFAYSTALGDAADDDDEAHVSPARALAPSMSPSKRTKGGTPPKSKCLAN
jgi:hypothetical protein